MKVELVEILALLGNKSAIIAADSGFIESRRILEPDGALSIQFCSFSGAIRELSFETKCIRFQGTTLRDLKWISDYTNFRELVLCRPRAGSVAGVLELVWKRGGSKRMGWISDECWERLREKVANSISFRPQIDP